MASIEERLSALEQQVSMQAELRAAVDSDLSDIAASQRAQALTIQALHITQAQHHDSLRRIEKTLGEHGQRLTGIERGLAQVVALLNQLVEQEPQQERP